MLSINDPWVFSEVCEYVTAKMRSPLDVPPTRLPASFHIDVQIIGDAYFMSGINTPPEFEIEGNEKLCFPWDRSRDADKPEQLRRGDVTP